MAAAAEDPSECPVNGTHKFGEHDESPAGPSRAFYCEHCGQPAPTIDGDGFAVRRPRRPVTR